MTGVGPQEILGACSGTVKNEHHVAYFLLPYVVTQVLLDGSDEDRNEVFCPFYYTHYLTFSQEDHTIPYLVFEDSNAFNFPKAFPFFMIFFKIQNSTS